MRKESPESTWTCEMLVYLTVSGLSLLDSRKYQLHFAQIFSFTEESVVTWWLEPFLIIRRILEKNVF